jgi:hypothetical protein
MTKPIPTPDECSKLWDEYYLPDHVRRHCALVRDCAVWLGQQLKQHGENVNLELVEAGALLHDLCRYVGEQQIKLKYFETPPPPEAWERWRALNDKYNPDMARAPFTLFEVNHPIVHHAQAAGSELISLGYPESLAHIVERHEFVKIIDPDERPATWEEKLVYYADKRVLHDRSVTLDERFSDGEVRYPEESKQPGEQLKREAIRVLEREIWDAIGMDPGELDARIAKPEAVS